ncbi:hypothetical protein BT93_G1641 [Corymbia citriodora subsp. variegata]|nr:hypothetical protein BT93_G1641 [Corymbia citriodora subsp. variegata]
MRLDYILFPENDLSWKTCLITVPTMTDFYRRHFDPVFDYDRWWNEVTLSYLSSIQDFDCLKFHNWKENDTNMVTTRIGSLFWCLWKGRCEDISQKEALQKPRVL